MKFDVFLLAAVGPLVLCQCQSSLSRGAPQEKSLAERGIDMGEMVANERNQTSSGRGYSSENFNNWNEGARTWWESKETQNGAGEKQVAAREKTGFLQSKVETARSEPMALQQASWLGKRYQTKEFAKKEKTGFQWPWRKKQVTAGENPLQRKEFQGSEGYETKVAREASSAESEVNQTGAYFAERYDTTAQPTTTLAQARTYLTPSGPPRSEEPKMVLDLAAPKEKDDWRSLDIRKFLNKR